MKDSNSRKTTPCPECKKTLQKASEMDIHGTFVYETKCSYCGKKVTVRVGCNPFVQATKIVVKTLIIFLLLTATLYQILLMMGMAENFAVLTNNYDFTFDPK